MEKDSRITAVPLMLALVAAWTSCNTAFAKPDLARKEKAACSLCHVNPAGGPILSDIGKEYKEKNVIPQDAAPVPEGRQAKYLGTDKCQLCHMKVHKSWEGTVHAAAFKVLESKQSDKNAGCITCHSTGAGLPGGYSPGSDQADALKQVTCEACHGPGSLHATAANNQKKETINGSPGEKLCRSCHIQRFSPKFEYVEWSKRGVHELTEKK